MNYGEGAWDGELAESVNLSTDQYPCITQRAARQPAGVYKKGTALHAKGELLVIDGTKVMYGGEQVNVTKVTEDGTEVEKELPISEGKKQTATVGNYIVIFPDKVYYRVATDTEPAEYGSMEAEYTAKGLKFTNNTITTPDANFKFREGDAVTISGCKTKENEKEIIIRSISDKEIKFADNSFTECTEEDEVTLKRKVPDLDFICECNYRLWGTHGNTIYSSKFSDPLNFGVFDGLASDSYAIELGTEGEFTGCIPYSSHICFFKENTLHKLYGTKPANFQVTTVSVYGVQSGSEKSMQIINEQLIYKGVGGVYAYTGGVPELISPKFGNRRFSEAVACSDGEKYYISMKQGEEWHLYTYDVLKNIWLREDDTHAVDMVFHKGEVYYLDSTGLLYRIDKTADRSDIEWEATFCTMHETIHQRKGYSKFHLRMDLSAGAWIAVDIKTDHDTQWKEVYTTHNEKARIVGIPIIPTRCDSIDIRLRGKGVCTIKTFVREFTVGSDVG